MAYSNEVLTRARRRLESAKADRESENRQHLQAAYEKLPRLKAIDLELRKTMALAAQAVFIKGGDAVATMEQVKNANLALQQERKNLVEAHFAPGYLDENPICGKCGGSGYVGSAMCSCLHDLCRQEQKKVLSVLSGGDADFQNFRLDYYSDQMDRELGASPRILMEKNLEVTKKFAYQFGADSGNLLFSGGTGLGKTYLAACIADVVADRGYSVAYESAQNLFRMLEKDRFHPDGATHAQVEQLYKCDLLILDDLGTELPGAFVNAAFYALLNQRIMEGKSMIISTNFKIYELAERYNPQIASRLRGNFQVRYFAGEDIRVKKNRGY